MVSMGVPKYIFERFSQKERKEVEVDMEVIKEILKEEVKDGMSCKI